jgi:hypothetical protein
MLLKPEAAELLKGMTGVTDDQIGKLHGGMAKLFNNVMNSTKFQTVAEVVTSEHCFAQVKVGDRLVFDPFLNPAKSKGVMCPRALLPVVSQIGAIWETAVERAQSGHEEPPEIIFRHIRCLDPGIENGGLGGVVYRLHMEPITP